MDESALRRALGKDASRQMVRLEGESVEDEDGNNTNIKKRRRQVMEAQQLRHQLDKIQGSVVEQAERNARLQAQDRQQMPLSSSQDQVFQPQVYEGFGSQELGTAPTTQSLVRKRKFLSGQTTQAELIFHPGQRPALAKRCQGATSIIGDLDSGLEAPARAQQVLHEIERYFQPGKKDLLPRRYGRHKLSQSVKPERPRRQVELASASSPRESDIQQMPGASLLSSLERGSPGPRGGGETATSGLISTRRSQQEFLDSLHPDALKSQRQLQDSATSSRALWPTSHREHQLACARSAISQLESKIAETPLYFRKLEGRMGYSKSKVLRISEGSPRRKATHSSRKAADDVRDSQATSRLPAISKSDARLRQSEVSGTETSGSIDEEAAPNDDQDADGEPQISRFMSQREKDLLWVAKQRRRMLRESKKLEADYLRALKEAKANEETKRRGLRRYRPSNDGVLPTLDDLGSRGATLSSRIKNYKTNLTALEGPVLDQIESVLQKIRVDNDREKRTERKARLQLLQRQGKQRTRSYLGLGGLSSPPSGVSSSIQDYSSVAPSKYSLMAESKLRLHRPLPGQASSNGGVLLDAVKHELGGMVRTKALTAEQKRTDIVRAKSKAEIVQGMDQRRQLRQHREEKKGLRLQGSSGSLDLTEVERMQLSEKERYIKIGVPKQIDHLVYRSHEADSDQGARYDSGDHSDSSHESGKSDKDDRQAKRRRSANRNSLQGRLVPSKLEQQRNRRFLEALQGQESSEEQSQYDNDENIKNALHRANFLPGPVLSKADRRRIQNLSMLQDHRPTSRERNMEYRLEHRRLLNYLEQVQQNMALPKLRELRRLRCLGQLSYEYLDLLNNSEGPGGLPLRERLAALPRERRPVEVVPGEAGPVARRGSDCLRAASRAANSPADAKAAKRVGRHSTMPNRGRASATADEVLQTAPTESQNKSSGLHTDESLANEQLQEQDGSLIDTFRESQDDLKLHQNGLDDADILVVASKSFGRGWRRALGPDQRRRDTLGLDDAQLRGDDGRPEGQEHANSDLASEMDLDSVLYGNESQLGNQRDGNDEQAFRKNKSNKDRQQELVQEISTSLLQKLKDISSKRQYVTRTASIEHMKHNQPAFAFFAECMSQQELDVPVFSGLSDDALFIQSQNLGTGQCVALANGFRVIQARNLLLKEVILHNNNLTDANQAVLIEGAGQVLRLKRFESIGNDFKDKSIEQIGRLLLRPAPSQLKELKLSDCKLAPSCTEKLLQILSKKCGLEQLSLQKAHYNKQAVGHLCDVIEHAKFLTNLDLSWCYIPKQQSTSYYIMILSSLGRNRKLSYINISWNNFCGYLPSASTSEEDLQNKQEEIAVLLTKIIKYNKKIMHLNLENTGLTRPMLKIIYPALTKAMSLQSLHLSNNPWLLKLLKEDPKFIARLHRKIRAKINKRPFVAAISRPDRKLKLPANNYELLRLGRLQQKHAYLKSQAQLDLDVDAFWQNKFIIQRRLGHKLDMPGAGQWQIVSDIVKHWEPADAEEEAKPEGEKDENELEKIVEEEQAREAGSQDQEKEAEEEDEEPYEDDLWKLTLPQPQECCWLCSHQRYVLLFWSRKIAHKVHSETRRLQEMEVASFVDKLLKQVHEIPDEEERAEIAQHLQMDRSRGLGDDLARGDLIQDPAVREEFAQALRHQRQREFGPIVNASINQDAVILKLLERKNEQYTDIFYDEKYDLAPEQTPHVLGGAVGDFRPQEMIELTEYCWRLDIDPATGLPARPPKTDILKQMRDQYTIGGDILHYEQLSTKQKLQYKLIANREERAMRKDCLALLVDSLRYRQPLLVNSEAAIEQLESDSSAKVYVLPMFLPPGKHTLLLSQKDRFKPTESCNLTLQTLLVEPREEPVPVFCKKAKTKRLDARAFVKEKSVFKDWQEDNKKILEKCLNDHDFQFWKVTRFIKDKAELDEVKQLLAEHMPEIKELYAFAQAESMVYPGINQTTLSDLCKILQVLDKNFQSKDSDRHFVACTSVRNKEQTELIEAAQAATKSRVEPSTSLFSWQGMKRFEFLEFLLRLIRNKYIEHMGYATIPPALRHFFAAYLPNFFSNPHVKLWQRFREKELWTLDVNDCLQVNLENLRKVYTAFCGKPRNFMNRAEAIRFMQWGAEAGVRPEAKKKGVTQQSQEPEPSKSPRAAVEGADLLQVSSAAADDGVRLGTASPRRLAEKPIRLKSPTRRTTPPRRAQSERSSGSRGPQKGGQGPAAGPSASASYLTLSEKQASFCYSMCKMTAIHEELDGLRHYDKLQFVEFLELLGRIASIRFEGTDLHAQPLVIRLEYIVDSTLAILGLERIEVKVDEQDISESDPDY